MQENPRVAFSLAIGAFCALFMTPLPTAAGAPTTPPRMKIEVRGAVALIELDRPLRLGRREGQRTTDEVVLDLALPVGARLARAELRGPGKVVRLVPGRRAAAAADYAAAIAEADWSRAKVAPQIDEGADLRLSVTGTGLGEGERATQLRVRARLVAPLSCRAGELVLAFPAALDPAPTAAEVEIDVVLGEGRAVRRVAVGDVAAPGGRLRTKVDLGGPWEVAIRPTATSAAGSLYAAEVARDGGGNVAALLCRGPSTKPAVPAPARVIFVLDHSRSVGPMGAASAGGLARALALALPPGTRFGAILFDRDVAPLFPVLRAPTLEAVNALEAAMGASGLRNGSRLLPALERAGRLLAQDAGGAGPSLLVVITDGALPEDHRATELGRLLAVKPLAQARAAVVVLRGERDERPAPFATRLLATLPARLGGLFRELDPSGAVAEAPALIAALAAGGDLVELAAPALKPRFSGNAVAPGASVFFLGRTGEGGQPIGLRGALGGRRAEFAATPVAIDSLWAPALTALLTPAPALPVFAAVPAALTDENLIALVTPPLDDPGAQKGGLDRDVLHKALAYAYLPRARACYLTRSIKNAADFQLRGRLRLELHLERGEMMEAVVARSTLGRPEIEACLRKAAFEVEIPRAAQTDAAAIAALNLVFRPRTEAASKEPAAAGDFDRAIEKNIERALGARRSPSDPLELLIEDDARQDKSFTSP